MDAHAPDPLLVDFADFEAFLAPTSLARHGLAGFFDPGSELVLSRAPGRLDVMGGIADYSGALVLEQPIREAALVAVARASDEVVRIASVSDSGLRHVEFSAPELAAASGELRSAHAYLRARGSDPWFFYLAGALVVLATELGCQFAGGLRLLLRSRVPEGKGVSSSAAIEVAALRALCDLHGVFATPEALALACQRLENYVVGAACGVMDQMTSACGEQGKLLMLRCQPASIVGQLALPDELELFAVDSGQRHHVSAAGYTQVRAAAFMGHRILAEALGASVFEMGPGRVRLEADPLNGYLANLAPSEFERLAALLPERMTGSDFLQRFRGITDEVTSVEPGASYAVRAATRHPVLEQARVSEFAALLAAASGAADLARLGELMLASHRSYAECGLGAPGTDRLVELAYAAGPANGLWGAKISGGGAGGAVIVLGQRGAAPAVHELSARYAGTDSQIARVFVGSSAGAWAANRRSLRAG